jgi:hypothetical protein
MSAQGPSGPKQFFPLFLKIFIKVDDNVAKTDEFWVAFDRHDVQFSVDLPSSGNPQERINNQKQHFLFFSTQDVLNSLTWHICLRNSKDWMMSKEKHISQPFLFSNSSA